MARIPVLFLVLLLALSDVLCDRKAERGKEMDTKQTVKPVTVKVVEKKSTNEKRESLDLGNFYNLKPKDEPFRPLYQFNYPTAPLRPPSAHYVSAATTQQYTYSKPDSVIGIGLGPIHAGGHSGNENVAAASSSGGVQYGTSYKPEGNIQYAPSSYKSGSGIQYASSAYRGPFITTPHHGQGRVHAGHYYTAQQPSSPPHPSAALEIPLPYGGIEQPLPSPHHQQNQFAIAVPAEYMRHYHQNLASSFPLNGAHMVQIIYTAGPASAVPPPLPPASPDVKDQQFKHSALQYISVAPHSSSQSPGSTVITHLIPFYGSRPPHHPHQHHQQFQHQALPTLYYGGIHQGPPSGFAFASHPTQQQTIEIAPKQQIYNPIQMAVVGAVPSAAGAVPFHPFKPIVAAQQQQLQQPLHHFHQHYHPGAASYIRYPQSISGSSGSNANPIEVPTFETSSSTPPAKQAPLYSSSSSTNSGNTYSGGTGGNSGKISYTYAPDTNYVGPIYSHPGAIHYGTHLYHPPTKVRVTAGSAVIAGVTPPSYHPQQQSSAKQ